MVRVKTIINIVKGVKTVPISHSLSLKNKGDTYNARLTFTTGSTLAFIKPVDFETAMSFIRTYSGNAINIKLVEVEL